MPSLFILGVSLEGGKGQVVMPAQLVEIEKEKRPDLWDEIRTVSTTGRGLSSMKKDDVLLISGHGSAEDWHFSRWKKLHCTTSLGAVAEQN